VGSLGKLGTDYPRGGERLIDDAQHENKSNPGGDGYKKEEGTRGGARGDRDLRNPPRKKKGIEKEVEEGDCPDKSYSTLGGKLRGGMPIPKRYFSGKEGKRVT